MKGLWNIKEIMNCMLNLNKKEITKTQMRTPMLFQASKLYTPIIFEAFQYEYERSMGASTTPLEGKDVVADF